MKTAIELAEVAGSFLPEEKGYFLMQAMSAMLRQQAEQIKRLQADLTTQAEINAVVTQLARNNAVECDSLKADAERIDRLSEMAHKRYGVALDYGKYVEDGLVLERGYRVTYYHKQGDRQPTLRAAIDAMKGQE